MKKRSEHVKTESRTIRAKSYLTVFGSSQMITWYRQHECAYIVMHNIFGVPQFDGVSRCAMYPLKIKCKYRYR